MIRLSSLSIAVVLIVGMPSHVQASIVNLTFSGTYEVGVTGAFSYSMTYDTSLANPQFFAAGADFAAFTATHDLYAYSSSGITAIDFQFNGLEWSLSELINDLFEIGGNNALWFDVDLATGATPTRALFQFLPSNQSDELYLYMGGYVRGPGNVMTFTLGSEIYEPSVVSGTDSLTITRSDPDPIPEPASVITWTLLGVVGCVATWWRRRRRAG